jgi:hypothetical protein
MHIQIYICIYKSIFLILVSWFEKNKCSTCLSEHFLKGWASCDFHPVQWGKISRDRKGSSRGKTFESRSARRRMLYMGGRWVWDGVDVKNSQPDSLMLFHVMIFLAVWRIWFGIDKIYGDICWFYCISQKIPIISHLVVFVISAPLCALPCSFCQHGSVALVKEIIPSPVISPWIPDWSLIYQFSHLQRLVQTHSWWLNLPFRTNQEGYFDQLSYTVMKTSSCPNCTYGSPSNPKYWAIHWINNVTTIYRL